MIYISDILDQYELDALCSALEENTRYEDGKNTAGRTAKKVKNNQQATAHTPVVTGARRLIEKALRKHPVFNAAALPHQFAKIMFNRYQEGMTYGTHVDEAFIHNVRTDLSFTMFLSEPATYQGGELVLCRHDSDESIKLDRGTLVLYPSTELHHITPVTSGTRLAAVGWIQSRVRSQEQRNILFDLYCALSQLADTDDNQSTRLMLLKVRSNLMRQWAD